MVSLFAIFSVPAFNQAPKERSSGGTFSWFITLQSVPPRIPVGPSDGPCTAAAHTSGELLLYIPVCREAALYAICNIDYEEHHHHQAKPSNRFGKPQGLPGVLDEVCVGEALAALLSSFLAGRCLSLVFHSLGAAWGRLRETRTPACCAVLRAPACCVVLLTVQLESARPLNCEQNTT